MKNVGVRFADGIGNHLFTSASVGRGLVSRRKVSQKTAGENPRPTHTLRPNLAFLFEEGGTSDSE